MADFYDVAKSNSTHIQLPLDRTAHTTLPTLAPSDSPSTKQTPSGHPRSSSPSSTEPPSKKPKTDMGGAHKDGDNNYTDDGFPDKVAPWNVPADAWEGTYHGSCHCGAVKFEAKGEPEASVCCHCTTCQVVHGATSQRAVIYKKDHIKFAKEALDSVAFYQTHDKKVGRHLPCKVRCKTCGTLIADEGRNMWLAFPALFTHDDDKEPDSFKVTDHMFYKQRRLDIERTKDDGVKFWAGAKDKSEEM